MSYALLDPDGVARLREALTTAGYTSIGIAERIGPAAVAAVRRNDLRALLRATDPATGDGADRLATLIRLFIAGRTEPVAAVAAALEPLPLSDAVQANLVEPDGDGLRAAVDLDVYTGHTGTDWWVLSDVDANTRPGRLRPDHVLGIGNAAITLADATIRDPVATALDLGTGCGVQALQLSTHAAAVTATDVSTRALRFAATTAALNGMSWELLAGDLVAPVRGRRFDLVVSNPPFVVGPGRARYTYRDSGRAGDGVCAELAAAAPDLLTEGGTMQFLANWLHVAGMDWRERVAGWVEGTGCDAWFVQREVSDPVEYVDLWLRDAGEPATAHEPANLDQPAGADEPAGASVLSAPRSRAGDPRGARLEWLEWFDQNKVEAVGFGVVTIRRSGRDQPVVRAEELRHSVEAPMGQRIAEWLARQDWLAGTQSLTDARLVRAPGLQLTQEAEHDGEDWAVQRQVLRLADGLRWAEEVDPVTLALVTGADGSATLGDQIEVLAAAFDTPVATLAAMLTPVAAHLVERGFLLPHARAPY
ncbi:MAG TPA: methyltransferase [Micromonosporaceae bacterium]|nr:methyltransferase [Micromonosporaceae bacterium]